MGAAWEGKGAIVALAILESLIIIWVLNEWRGDRRRSVFIFIGWIWKCVQVRSGAAASNGVYVFIYDISNGVYMTESYPRWLDN